MKKSKEKKTKKEEKIDAFGLTEKQQKALKEQVQFEYKTAKDWIQPFYQKSYKNLKLYLNEKRDDDKVGDPILYTVMNTIHASMYSDIPEVKWKMRTIEGAEMEANWNLLTEFDYEEMRKDELDMDWLWDTCFFGYGILDNIYFDRELKAPAPRLVDPFSFLYDPDTPAELDNARFCGEEKILTSRELKEGPYENVDKVATGTDFNKLPTQAARARTEAQGKNEQTEETQLNKGDNEKKHIVEWRTWFDGKRILVGYSNDFENMIRYKELDDQKTWGYVEKKISRTSHSFKGASIPDMVGDKQRMRSEIINLAAAVVKSQQYPHYVYNSNLIRNKADLSFGFNKFTGVPGSPRDAVLPMNQYTPNMQMTNYILQYLDSASQRATASAEMQQGVLAGQERTVGELNLVAQKADTRYSLMMKTLLIGEKKFWKQWYRLYKKHFKKELDEKVIRLTKQIDEEFYTLTHDDLFEEGYTDPDVQVLSTAIEESKRQKKMGKYIQFMNASAASPETDRRMMLKQFGKVLGLDERETNYYLPPTLDEIVAERQNIMFADKKGPMPEVKAADNHMVHLRVHRKAEPNAKRNAHMMTHLQALVMMRDNPELDPNNQQMQADQEGLQPGEPGGIGEVGFQPTRAAEHATSEDLTPAQEAKMSNEQAYGYPG